MINAGTFTITDINTIDYKPVLQQTLQVGNMSYSLNATAQQTPINLYQGDPDNSANVPVFQQVARISHRLTVKADSSMAASSLLRNQSDLVRREREANKTTLLSTNSTINQPAVATASTSITSTPTSMFLNTPGTPANPPSRASSASPTASAAVLRSKPKRLAISTTRPLSALNLSAAPNRLVHLLALGPLSFETILNRTNISQVDLENLLKQYATVQSTDSNEGNNTIYALADNVYKDLRVWEWKHYTAAQRAQVLKRSTEVFDKLGYPETHVARRLLVDPKIRQAEKEKADAEREAETEARYAAEQERKEREEQEAMQKALAEISAKKEERERVKKQHQQQNTSNGSSSMLQKVVKKAQNGGNGSLTVAKKMPSSTSAASSANPSPVPSPSLSAVGSAITSSSRRQQRELRERELKEQKEREKELREKKTKKRRLSVSVIDNELLELSEKPKRQRSSSNERLSEEENTKVPSAKGIGLGITESEDYTLVIKFKEKYARYEKLYKGLKRETERGDSDKFTVPKEYQRMIMLQNDLEKMKRRIWNMSPPVSKPKSRVKSEVHGHSASTITHSGNSHGGNNSKPVPANEPDQKAVRAKRPQKKSVDQSRRKSTSLSR